MCALCYICFFVFPGVDDHLMLVFTAFSKKLSLIHLHTFQQKWKSLHTIRHLILSVTLLEASLGSSILPLQSKLVGFHLLYSCCPMASLYHRPGDSLCLSATAFPVYCISCVSLLQITEKRHTGEDRRRRLPIVKSGYFSPNLAMFSVGISLLASTEPDLLNLG